VTDGPHGSEIAVSLPSLGILIDLTRGLARDDNGAAQEGQLTLGGCDRQSSLRHCDAAFSPSRVM
jgi:hypothetical protein